MTATTTRTRRPIETPEYTQMVIRMVRGLGRRVGTTDVDELSSLLVVAEEAERVFRETGLALNAAGYSWAQIGARLGVEGNSARRRCQGRRTAAQIEAGNLAAEDRALAERTAAGTDPR